MSRNFWLCSILSLSGPTAMFGIPRDNGWQRVFGGQVIAQALVAAQRTVEGERRIRCTPISSSAAIPRADRLRGRAHPRRAQLRDPSRRRAPTRRSDFRDVRLVPCRGRGSRSPVADARAPAPEELRPILSSSPRSPGEAARQQSTRLLRAHPRRSSSARSISRRYQPMQARRERAIPRRRSGCGSRAACPTIPRCTAPRSPISPT